MSFVSVAAGWLCEDCQKTVRRPYIEHCGCWQGNQRKAHDAIKEYFDGIYTVSLDHKFEDGSERWVALLHSASYGRKVWCVISVQGQCVVTWRNYEGQIEVRP